MIRNPKDLQRYNAEERTNHWVSGISFILLALSGLALFHPAFYPLSQLFGGGTWTRILHPFIGVVMMIAFVSMFFRFKSLNKMTPADKAWLDRIDEMIEGDDHNMPEQGKYNGGQKRMFWAMSVSMLLLIVSGFVIWHHVFPLFPIELMRVGMVVHAAAAAVMIGLVMVHVYAAIWVKGTIRAMWIGTVTRAWARQHHRAWYREMTGKS